MTYITAHLPELDELKIQLEDPNRIEIYMKYMGFQGPDGSIDYLTKKIEEYINSKKSNE